METKAEMDNRSNVLKDEYQARFQRNASYRESVWKLLCDLIFSRYVSPEHVVLDLGAGWGEFSRNIQARKRYAMDLNPDCGQRVDGFAEFIQQDCSKKWPLADGSLDIVFTSNFLEHLPSKNLVDKTLAEAHRCLRSERGGGGGGGKICVGPNIRHLPGEYWDYWDHYIPITGASLVEALSLQGFSIEHRVDRFLPYTMSSGRNPPLVAVSTYLRIPFFWSFFGKQFFIVGKK
jgi:hypothetical protein